MKELWKLSNNQEKSQPHQTTWVLEAARKHNLTSYTSKNITLEKVKERRRTRMKQEKKKETYLRNVRRKKLLRERKKRQTVKTNPGDTKDSCRVFTGE